MNIRQARDLEATPAGEFVIVIQQKKMIDTVTKLAALEIPCVMRE